MFWPAFWRRVRPILGGALRWRPASLSASARPARRWGLDRGARPAAAANLVRCRVRVGELFGAAGGPRNACHLCCAQPPGQGASPRTGRLGRAEPLHQLLALRHLLAARLNSPSAARRGAAARIASQAAFIVKQISFANAQAYRASSGVIGHLISRGTLDCASVRPRGNRVFFAIGGFHPPLPRLCGPLSSNLPPNHD